jgi:tetratricopeptide (TPR) repeat protein
LLQHWVSPRWLEELVRIADKRGQSNAALKQALDKLLQANPGLETVLSILFERGDAEGRRFALQIAGAAQLPLLCDFARGENGTDQERAQAAQTAAQIGLLPRGKPVSMLVKGKRDEMLLFGYEITGEVVPNKLSSQAKKAMQATADAINQADFARAERLAHEALALAPDDPTLHNHLIAALQGQDRDQEAQVLIRQLAERFPDYLFGRVSMARLCAREGKTDEANRWLEPLLSREQFHYSEFAALCVAQIELMIAERKFDGAQSWLRIWEQVIPDDPRQDVFRRQLRGK